MMSMVTQTLDVMILVALSQTLMSTSNSHDDHGAALGDSGNQHDGDHRGHLRERCSCDVCFLYNSSTGAVFRVVKHMLFF